MLIFVISDVYASNYSIIWKIHTPLLNGGAFVGASAFVGGASVIEDASVGGASVIVPMIGDAFVPAFLLCDLLFPILWAVIRAIKLLFF